MTNNPIKVAMEKANLTAERVADMLGVTRQTINNYVKNPGQIPAEKIYLLSQETGISMEKLYGPISSPEGPNLEPVYSENVIKLNKYIETAENVKNDIFNMPIDKKQEYCIGNRDRAISELEDVIKATKIKGRKPTVCAFGPSDAGKSSLINFIIGEKITPAGYSPMTTVPTYIKHISEKPAFLDDPADNAIVLGNKKTSKREFVFDNDQILIGDYDEKNVIRKGNYGSVLEEFGTRDGEYYKKSNYNIKAIVVYADADILKEMTFIDIPGFDSGDDADNVGLAIDASTFDVIFFLSTADAYLRGHELVAFCNALKMRENLSSIYLLATHTNSIGDPNIVDEIINKGCKRIVDTMANAEKKRLKINEKNYDGLKERCIGFDLASQKSCKELNRIIEEELPNIIKRRIGDAIKDAEKVAKEYKKKYKKMSDDIDQERRYSKSAENLKDEQKKNKEAVQKSKKHLEKMKSKMNDSIANKRVSSCDEMRKEYETIIDEDNIVKAIEDKGLNNRKNDLEDLSNYLSNEINDALNHILSEKSEAFANELEAELEGYKDDLLKDSKSLKMSTDFQGFDVARAFAAGLTGLATYGALAAWAMIVANGSHLGAYILIVKIVSFLSTIGISLGGTAAVNAFVAAIGGPVVLGIALSVLAAVTAFGIFSGTWKNRVAKRLVKTYKEKDVLKKCIDAIDRYWDDTEVALDKCIASLEEQFEKYYEEQKTAACMSDEEYIKMVTILQMLYSKVYSGYNCMCEAVG